MFSAPDWFDDEWVSKIRHDTGDNRRLKVSEILLSFPSCQ